MSATHEQLSQEGQQRRQEILRVAIAESQRLQRLRKLKRVTAATAFLLLVIAASVQFYRMGSRAPQPQLADQEIPLPENSESSIGLNQDVAQHSDAVQGSELLLQERAASDVLIVSTAASSVEVNLGEYVVRPDVGDLAGYIVSSRSDLPADLLLDDRQLAVMLASLGRPGAVVRTDDGVFLIQ